LEIFTSCLVLFLFDFCFVFAHINTSCLYRADLCCVWMGYVWNEEWMRKHWTNFLSKLPKSQEILDTDPTFSTSLNRNFLSLSLRHCSYQQCFSTLCGQILWGAWRCRSMRDECQTAWRFWMDKIFNVMTNTQTTTQSMLTKIVDNWNTQQSHRFISLTFTL
jgi:hypothetical protein